MLSEPEGTLWKMIQRYDSFIAATNAKAAFLIAYNTFVIGAVLLQVANLDKIAPAATAANYRTIFLILIGAIAGTGIVSLVFVMLVIKPYLRSGSKPGLYHSVLFFETVAAHSTAEEYVKQFTSYNQENMVEDLSRQVHVLAIGLSKKFKLLGASIRCTIMFQLPLLAVFVGFLLVRLAG